METIVNEAIFDRFIDVMKKQIVRDQKELREFLGISGVILPADIPKKFPCVCVLSLSDGVDFVYRDDFDGIVSLSEIPWQEAWAFWDNTKDGIVISVEIEQSGKKRIVLLTENPPILEKKDVGDDGSGTGMWLPGEKHAIKIVDTSFTFSLGSEYDLRISGLLDETVSLILFRGKISVLTTQI